MATFAELVQEVFPATGGAKPEPAGLFLKGTDKAVALRSRAVSSVVRRLLEELMSS